MDTTALEAEQERLGGTDAPPDEHLVALLAPAVKGESRLGGVTDVDLRRQIVLELRALAESAPRERSF